jgi:hypothetical protein
MLLPGKIEMTWEQIRAHYPDQWVIMEALQAKTDGDRRVFEQLAVLDSCVDNGELFPRYKKLRAAFPGKELIFYHSANTTMDVKIKNWYGVRVPK